MSTVTVMGLGFVGLTTALGLAYHGHTVYGIDRHPSRQQQLNRGNIPFHEPGLQEALHQQLKHRFFPTDDLPHALQESDFVFYCVGTPCQASGSTDMGQLLEALQQTKEALSTDSRPKNRVLVVKSTIPPGTSRDQLLPFLQKTGLTPEAFHLAVNPEFLQEGRCWHDFIYPDRIVIGAEDPLASQRVAALYDPFNAPVVQVNLTTAEYIKYLSNGLLATLISYANEQSLIADAIGGIDVPKAFATLHQDQRWADGSMKNYAYPGCGFGGACLPKDLQALEAQAQKYGINPALVKSVNHTNRQMPAFLVQRIERIATSRQTIGVLGLAFKPGSEDVRNTTALHIIQLLQEKGYQSIMAYDPLATGQFRRHYPALSVDYAPDMATILEQAHVLVIVTAWPEFANLRQQTNKPIVDGRYTLKEATHEP